MIDTLCEINSTLVVLGIAVLVHTEGYQVVVCWILTTFRCLIRRNPPVSLRRTSTLSASRLFKKLFVVRCVSYRWRVWHTKRPEINCMIQVDFRWKGRGPPCLLLLHYYSQPRDEWYQSLRALNTSPPCGVKRLAVRTTTGRTPPENRQLNILIGNGKQEVDDFVGGLAF